MLHCVVDLLVLVQVDVQFAVRDVLPVGQARVNQQLPGRRHLGPYKRHLGTEPETAAGLLHAILCARQYL